MGVGKIAYNGGSGIKGGVEAQYTVNTSSEEIKSGNFVEKIELNRLLSDTATNIVLDTTQLNNTPIISQTALSNNRILAAYADNSKITLKLYSVKTSVIPILLDSYELAFSGTVALKVFKVDDNTLAIGYGDSNSVYVGLLSVENNTIELGTPVYIYWVSLNSIEFVLFNQAELGVFALTTSHTRACAFAIQDLDLINRTALLDMSAYNLNTPMNCKPIGNNSVVVTGCRQSFSNMIVVSTYQYDSASNRITGTYSQTVAGSKSLPHDIIPIDSNKALILYQNSNTNVSGVIATFAANLDISFGTAYSLKNDVSASGLSSLRLIEYAENAYMAVYDDKASLITLNSNVITMSNEQTVSSMNNSVSVSSPMNNRVCIFYKNLSYYPTLSQCGVSGTTISNAVPVYEYYYEMKKAISKIDGVAKNSGVASDTITVYELGGNG